MSTDSLLDSVLPLSDYSPINLGTYCGSVQYQLTEENRTKTDHTMTKE